MDREGACGLAESLRTKIMELQIPHEKSHTAPYVTVSLGVSSLRHEDDVTAAQMVKRADDALYQAKNSGRNNVVALP